METDLNVPSKSNKQKNWILNLISIRDQDRTKMLDRQGSMVMTDYLCKVARNFYFENGWRFWKRGRVAVKMAKVILCTGGVSYALYSLHIVVDF